MCVFLQAILTVETLKIVLTCAAIIGAILAALAWLVSTRVEVDAPEGSGGIGALLGGDLVALNKVGKRIDLPKTPIAIQIQFMGGNSSQYFCYCAGRYLDN